MKIMFSLNSHMVLISLNLNMSESSKEKAKDELSYIYKTEDYRGTFFYKFCPMK